MDNGKEAKHKELFELTSKHDRKHQWKHRIDTNIPSRM